MFKLTKNSLKGFVLITLTAALLIWPGCSDCRSGNNNFWNDFMAVQNVYAAESYYDTVKDGSISGGYFIMKADSAGDIITASRIAASEATKACPYKIVIKPGSYTLEYTIRIGSNTYLYAQGATITQKSGVDRNMIRTDEEYPDEGADGVIDVGYANKNIVIDGGTWSLNHNSNTLLKLMYGSNIKVKNATFMNAKDAHLCEAAGIKGLTFEHCTFKNQRIDGTTYEALQLDILEEDHMGNIHSEDLAMQDVTVNKCKFVNVPRGVGSHSAILNSPIKNVKITNNTFTNDSTYKKYASCAIQLLSVRSCTISGNTISNFPRGISVFGGVFTKQETFLSTDIAKEGNTTAETSVSYKTPTDMKITISKNKITLGGTDPYAYYEYCGIWVCGLDCSKTTVKAKSGSKLPKGNYYVKGVVISSNTVKGNGHGIKLENARNVTVTGNKLTFTGSKGKINYYGITARVSAKSFTVKSNKINAGYINNIYIKDSAAKDILKNTCTSPVKYNIAVENGSAANISYNVCKKAKVNGIHIWSKSKVTKILSNKITGAKNKGIYVGNKSKVTKIQKNKFKSCKAKLVVASDSKVKTAQ